MDLPQVVHHYVEVHHFVHFIPPATESYFNTPIGHDPSGNFHPLDVSHPDLNDSHAPPDGYTDLMSDDPPDDPESPDWH